MADVDQEKQRRSTKCQVGPPQSVSLYPCDWTDSQRHFCRRFLVCGTGRAHLFPKTRNINFGIKIFSWVAHFNMCFSGKMTETLQGTVLEFTLPSWHLHDLRCCWTFNKMIRVISSIWAMELCEDQANYWVWRVCPCLLMQRWLVSGANLNKGEWQRQSWLQMAHWMKSHLITILIYGCTQVLFKPKSSIILWSMSEKASWCWKFVSVTWAEEVQFSSYYRADEDTGFGRISRVIYKMSRTLWLWPAPAWMSSNSVASSSCRCNISALVCQSFSTQQNPHTGATWIKEKATFTEQLCPLWVMCLVGLGTEVLL